MTHGNCRNDPTEGGGTWTGPYLPDLLHHLPRCVQHSRLRKRIISAWLQHKRLLSPEWFDHSQLCVILICNINDGSRHLFEKAVAARIRSLDPETAASHLTALGTNGQPGFPYLEVKPCS